MSDRILLQVTTGPLAGKSFSLGRGDLISVGHDASCQIRFPVSADMGAKQLHIFYHPKGKLLVKPAGKGEGVKVNGKAVVDRKTLKLNDRIAVGLDSVIVVTGWDAAQATDATLITSDVVTEQAMFSQGSKSHAGAFAMGLAAMAIAFGGFWIFKSQASQNARAAKIPRSPTKVEMAQAMSPQPAPSSQAKADPPPPASKPTNIQNFRGFIWDEIVNVSKRFGDTPPSVMDPSFVAAVEQCISQYTANDYHKELLAKRDVYQKMLAKVMRDHQLPTELAYVVWVESKYNPKAASSAGAAGLWQLLPGTAAEYGLRVPPNQDERLDPYKSSVAAAKYFQALMKTFGNDRYLLALAAYNTGQNRIMRRKLAQTIRRSQDADFWHLRNELPKETLDYVPRILAAIIIARNPDRF